jgi:glutamyl-Q tRNA(Asp) synthetase
MSLTLGSRYIGRFAPSPTGPLHAGSLAAALASWLDARSLGGTWLVRMEDVDEPRCSTAAADEILRQLAVFGLVSDQPPVVQSQRTHLYRAALDRLVAQGNAYACACSRKDIEEALAARGIGKPRHGELVYPGTCRDGLHGRTARAWRFRLPFDAVNQASAGVLPAQAAIKSIATSKVHWTDRRLGAQQQNVAEEVGDFVLRRADGYFAYQLAVVVDDAAQGITHVVRGADLADNTARQILLQQALGVPTPQYLHTPLVLAADGQKLSKQNGAAALDCSNPVRVLGQAAAALGLHAQGASVQALLANCVAQWANHYNLHP